MVLKRGAKVVGILNDLGIGYQIEVKRREMIELSEMYGMTNEDVLKISEELDELIIKIIREDIREDIRENII